MAVVVVAAAAILVVAIVVTAAAALIDLKHSINVLCCPRVNNLSVSLSSFLKFWAINSRVVMFRRGGGGGGLNS